MVKDENINGVTREGVPSVSFSGSAMDGDTVTAETLLSGNTDTDGEQITGPKTTIRAEWSDETAIME